MDPCPYALPIVSSDCVYCRNPQVRTPQQLATPAICAGCKSRDLELPMRPEPEQLPEPINPYGHLNCRFLVETSESVKCKLCGGQNRSEPVYLCECPSVKQEKATMRRVQSGGRYACCLGCRHAEN